MATKVDPTDPAVRQLVYKHYRGILGKYNDKANSIVSTLPRDRVKQDQGITDKLESMIRQSNQIQNNCTDAPISAPTGNGAPPPPPPPCAGNIPSVRLASEIGPRKVCEPPAAIQNAMMTKDKKPFTYTPGGLNLNEIRSPRMARRISRNAHTEDSCTPSLGQQQAAAPTGPLPPAALAAMQPQIAIPVFPPGGAPPAPPPPPPPPSSGGPPPPPPPPPQHSGGAPPPPPPQSQTTPPAPAGPMVRPHDFPRPDFLSDIERHPPLKPVGQPPRSSYDPQASQPLQVQLKPVSPKPSPDPSTPQQPPPFLTRPTVEIPQQTPVPQVPRGPAPPVQSVTPPTVNRAAPPTPPLVRSAPATPPIQQVRAPPTPPVQDMRAPATPPIQQVRAPMTPPVQEMRAPATPPVGGLRQPATPPIQQQRTPPTPPTPSLNKSPAPWLMSKPAQKEVSPPWAVRQQSIETPPPTPPTNTQQTSQQGQQPVTRVIPIHIEGREPTPQLKTASPSPQPYYNQAQTTTSPSPQPYYNQTQMPNYPPPPQYPQGANSQQQRYVQPPQAFQNYATPQYAAPQPYQQPNQHVPGEQVKTRIIPIQMEGSDNGTSQPGYYSQNSTGNGQIRSQNGDAGDPRRFQTQTSYTGNPTQSRSFRVLQKITGSDDDAPASERVSGECNSWGTNTPPLYPNYWYYPPQTPEEQQQFWEHYNAMCNYMAHMNATAMRYSPYPFAPYPYPYPPYPSDTEDYSNSSCDEMTQYGKMFKEHQQHEAMKNMNGFVEQNGEETPTPEHNTEDSSDSDTEIGDVPINSIQSIKSVPDIHVYANSDDTTSEESESSEDDEEPESDATSLPHQLSVIFEESELSSEESKRTSGSILSNSNNSSTSTINNEEDDDNAVKVRLPLKLQFTRSENDVEVATLIVGNSEMESTNTVEDGNLIITDIVKEEEDPDVTATIVLKKPKKETAIKDRENESPVDFWKELNDDKGSRCSSVSMKNEDDDFRHDESDCHGEDDSSSTSVLTVKKGNSGTDSLSELETSDKIENNRSANNSVTHTNESDEDDDNEDEEEEETSDSSSEDLHEEEDEKECTLLNNKECGNEVEEEEEEDEDESESSDTTSSSDEESDEHSNVFNDPNEISSEKVKDKAYLSSKSFEESEEDDSGVTSDLSRHISETDTDPECGSELSKMSRCQRAATHSRLFKLLQDECEQEDAREEYENMAQRKERLTLPLTSYNGDDSMSSSSGVNSPSSPGVTERLIKELIQSLLSKKKGRHFRKLPMEKLHAAALRILQEDMDQYDTVSTSDESNLFLSPVSNPPRTNTKTPVNTYMNPEAYGANYYDYCNYYNTWGSANNDFEPEYDIVPSKTFKILQGQADRCSPQTVRGVPSVRCPRVPTSNLLRENLTTPVPSTPSPFPKDS